MLLILPKKGTVDLKSDLDTLAPLKIKAPYEKYSATHTLKQLTCKLERKWHPANLKDLFFSLEKEFVALFLWKVNKIFSSN